jgi:hypothetical protein
MEDAAKAAGVKQGSGVVGKLCTAANFGFVAMAAGLYAIASAKEGAPGTALAGVAFVGVTLLAFAAMMLWYAKQDRLGAGMESADLLQAYLKEIEVAQKDRTASVPTGNVAPPQVEAAQVVPPQVEQVEAVKEPAQ